MNERTSKLLEQSKVQAEALANQEEELRQTMEEMHATQEEMLKKNKEMEALLAMREEDAELTIDN